MNHNDFLQHLMNNKVSKYKYKIKCSMSVVWLIDCLFVGLKIKLYCFGFVFFFLFLLLLLRQMTFLNLVWRFFPVHSSHLLLAFIVCLKLIFQAVLLKVEPILTLLSDLILSSFELPNQAKSRGLNGSKTAGSITWSSWRTY